MTLETSFLGLPPAEQRLVHLHLCAEALEVWNSYASKEKPIHYTDTVVGMGHTVDISLPAEALNAARAGADQASIQGRYREPIVSLQDIDLELPDPVEFAYYAIYNCFRLHAIGESIDPWLIVNQSLSCIDDPKSWDTRLSAAVKVAHK